MILALFSIFTFLILLLLNNSPLTFIDIPVIDAFYIKNNKIDLVNTCIALSTTISAAGLCYFSYLTYRNQKNQEFESLFNTLFQEHNKLIKTNDFIDEIIKTNIKVMDNFIYIYSTIPSLSSNYEDINISLNCVLSLLNEENKISSNQKNEIKSKLDNISELFHIIIKVDHSLDKIVNNIVQMSGNFRISNNIDYSNLAQLIKEAIEAIKCKLDINEDKSNIFNKETKEIIDNNALLKPYLIILYRLLKYINNNAKISNESKHEYFGLVRATIPSNVLFLLLFNSIGWTISNNKLYPSYSQLIIKSRLLEHLNIEQEFTSNLHIKKDENTFRNLSINHIDNLKDIFNNYIINGTAIDIKAFGDNVQIRKLQQHQSISK
jgi:hypothetical protein